MSNGFLELVGLAVLFSFLAGFIDVYRSVFPHFGATLKSGQFWLYTAFQSLFVVLGASWLRYESSLSPFMSSGIAAIAGVSLLRSINPRFAEDTLRFGEWINEWRSKMVTQIGRLGAEMAQANQIGLAKRLYEEVAESRVESQIRLLAHHSEEDPGKWIQEICEGDPTDPHLAKASFLSIANPTIAKSLLRDAEQESATEIKSA